jgi:ATP adenylyltransferase
MEYIDQLHEKSDGCFLCSARDNPDQDDKNFLVKRGKFSFAILNRFPYTGGHMLIAPYQHTGDLIRLDDGEMLELMTMTRDMQQLLAKVLRAEGFNVGINLARCAGAGLPDHLHLHIVPRWSGDTNFMPVIGDVRVIPEAIDKFYRKLKAQLDPAK